MVNDFGESVAAFVTMSEINTNSADKELNATNTGCPKINETHKIANKYVDFNPIVYIFQI